MKSISGQAMAPACDVPSAAKATDAATLGGLRAPAFVLARTNPDSWDLGYTRRQIEHDHNRHDRFCAELYERRYRKGVLRSNRGDTRSGSIDFLRLQLGHTDPGDGRAIFRAELCGILGTNNQLSSTVGP